MITSKQIERALGFARPALESHFGVQKAQRLLMKMEANYQEIGPEVPILKSSTNQSLMKIAVDVLAFYKALLTEMPQSEATKLLQPFVDNWFDGLFERWIARVVYANRRLHLPFRRRMIANATKANEPDGSMYEFIEPTGGLFYGVNTTRCGPNKFLTRMGAPELTPFLCAGDYYIQKYLPNGILFERTQTIAEGAAICDFRYIKAENEFNRSR